MRAEKADALPRSPLSLPHTDWQTGRSFAVHSPNGSLSGCYEWMSLRCWTPGSAANTVPTAGLVLVALDGHADAQSDQQMLMIHPI